VPLDNPPLPQKLALVEFASYFGLSPAGDPVCLMPPLGERPFRVLRPELYAGERYPPEEIEWSVPMNVVSRRLVWSC
jgi:hypothetical protein